jgi:hypothetical protein
MSKVGLVIGLVLFVLSAWYTFGYAMPNYFAAQEELERAQKEYDASVVEFQQSQQELHNVINEELAKQ